ncbi:hypothetical protein RB653_007475, partial [Dictyostelium firmibasis]
KKEKKPNHLFLSLLHTFKKKEKEKEKTLNNLKYKKKKLYLLGS